MNPARHAGAIPTCEQRSIQFDQSKSELIQADASEDSIQMGAAAGNETKALHLHH